MTAGIGFIIAALAALSATAVGNSSSASAAKDWDLRLIDGHSSNEGTLLVRFGTAWGLVCDDGWDSRGADVACHQLGFGRSLEYSVANKYSSSLAGKRIVLDDVSCSGRERRLSDCRSRPLGVHDCRPSEAAGVRCSVLGAAGAKPATLGLAVAPWAIERLPKRLAKPSYKLKQVNSSRSAPAAGGPIVAIVDGVAGGLCADWMTLREGNVVCRELGLGFAKSIWRHSLSDLAVGKYGSVLSVANCRGSEKRLSQCAVYGSGVLGSPCSDGNTTVGVTCTVDLPDLIPDARVLQSSAYATQVPMWFMTCALEENCASPVAFEVQANNPHWQYTTRTLLRFSTIVGNHGTSDFLPVNGTEAWTWHTCHMHYHSMAYFAAYELYLRHNSSHQTVASGHKASFCLEDNACNSDTSPKFRCSQDPRETGTQGISPGCSDNYLHDLDCQWIDITEVPFGVYQFRMVINPEYLAAELSFDNNAVVCGLVYSPSQVQLHGCRMTHPFDS